MSILMLKELDRLRKTILSLSAIVEESVNQSVKAVVDRDADRARRVIEGDRKIDGMEIEVEEECLKILALHQPVAADLRYIIAVSKINNDLERVGDLAVNISEYALALTSLPYPVTKFDLSRMADKVRSMLKRSLDALVDVNAELAEEVRESDDAVDDMHRDNFQKIKASMRERPEEIDALMHILSISRRLERIADHATNISEDVIYLTRGEIVRHGSDMKEQTREKP